MSRWDALLAVQEHDTRIDQLEHRRRTLPARAELDGAMAELAKLEQRAAEVQATRHDLARSQQRLEDEIASINAKAAQHDAMLYGGTIGNPRELQALQEEIGSLRRRVSQLEDQELELMEQLEPVDADLARLAQERAGLDERAGTLRAQIAEDEVAIEEELATVRTERGELVETVEPELLAEYEQLRPHTGGIAIARLVSGHCGGCHLALSAVEVDRIKKLPVEASVHCEECGRLLAR
ncbi:MAG TPA: C4-type zinc ribbon domain-containing protein [Acidimicrobiales bacterium]|jgi:predicted  nucleic acid-binding Zn-ribbon protein|nr:C4-type zinc ribbon domain-containing protein [Acidimicrobiales bacterium]